VAAVVAEDAVQQPAGPVHHGGLLVEVGRRRHEARDGEHPGHAVETAELVLEHRQGVERAHLGRLCPLLDADVVAEGAHTRERPVDARQLPRRARHVSVHDHGVERVMGWMGPVQGEAQ
jgi:hypothetical protein